ncbi:cation diffusion facilitator family transporter [Clostridium sp.]|uniref:cation diffusion facilitator family transporter n=1 Tax=Clostridium sp. TaxID=1506 RepID=UPI0025C4D40B|nr:cation diffusion facilitator family transporter [Clostridium sp.]
MSEHNHTDKHDHGHSHNHDVSNIKGINLLITMILNLVITVAEIIGGLYSGSLSLISDAVHNLSDALSIVVSYFAIKMSQRSNDENKTFGYKRATILAALINSTALIAISIFLFKEAYFKFLTPKEINGAIVVWVALIGLLANTLGAYLLYSGSKGDMNMKSAYLHLLSDALSSIGVVIGGIVIYYFDIFWIDPLLTVLIGLYVLKESIEILKQAINILMQGTPENIDINEIVEELKEIEAIENVHHIHVWSLNDNTIFFEAHVNLKNDILISETSEIYEKIDHELKEHFGISHITVQLEFNRCEGCGIINKN